uniref:Uncharacterized protein n=1 Tax=Oryza brachyantha TaxID=4533 RepID=J3NDP1_ORYBR
MGFLTICSVSTTNERLELWKLSKVGPAEFFHLRLGVWCKLSILKRIYLKRLVLFTIPFRMNSLLAIAGLTNLKKEEGFKSDEILTVRSTVIGRLFVILVSLFPCEVKGDVLTFRDSILSNGEKRFGTLRYFFVGSEQITYRFQPFDDRKIFSDVASVEPEALCLGLAVATAAGDLAVRGRRRGRRGGGEVALAFFLQRNSEVAILGRDCPCQ